MGAFRSRIRHVVLTSVQTSARLTFYIFASRTDLCSEVCLKAISRAKKSALEMKIGQIVHDMLLFLKRLRHLEFLVYVFCCSASKLLLKCKNWISSLCDIERCMGQASKIIFDEKQGQQQMLIKSN